jgi:DNA-binding transcriptional ArsR family regulator
MAYQKRFPKVTARPRAAQRDRDLSLLLSALGDPMRQQIVESLRRGPRSVGELADSLPVSRPAVSQHLKVLKSAGIVSESRAGVRHYFSLDATAVEVLRCHFEAMWQDVLLAFATYVKEKERERKAE